MSVHTEHDEIAEVARQLWNERGGTGGSPEEDWYRAERIVRERQGRAQGGSGNRWARNESYVRGTGESRSPAEPDWKEHRSMENTTGSTEQTGIMDRARQTADRAMSNASQYMQNEPQSFPRPEHREGRIARSIEQQTARIPSDAWLWAAVGSMGLSLALELSGKDKTANFVGHWAPTLLIFGLYNKMVKLQGSDGL